MSSFLFINQYYWPDEAATAQLLSNLAEDLITAGHQVTVLCGRSRYSCAEEVKSGVSRHHGVQIERVGGSDLGRYRWEGRITDILSFMWGAGCRLRHIATPDAVIAMTSPPLVGRLGARYHRKRRVPLVLWAQDIYPEVAERLGILKSPILCRWSHAISRRIYRESARVIVPGRDMQAYLETCREAAGKVCTIPNWVDLEQVRCGPVQGNSFRKEYGWEKDRILMYSGNLGAAHEMETILPLVSVLEAEVPSLHFVLVGDTPRHKAFAEKAKNMRIHRMTCLPFQPLEKLGDLLGAADAHLVSQKPEVDGLLVPSKFYGAVAAGRPIIFIGSRTAEVGRHVMDSQLGVVIAPGQASVGVRAAKKVLLMTQDENWVVAYIRDWAQANASRAVRTRQFQALLEEVVAC